MGFESKGPYFFFQAFFHKIFVKGEILITEFEFCLVEENVFLTDKKRGLSFFLENQLDGVKEFLNLLQDEGVVGIIDSESFRDGIDLVEEINPGPNGFGIPVPLF